MPPNSSFEPDGPDGPPLNSSVGRHVRFQCGHHCINRRFASTASKVAFWLAGDFLLDCQSRSYFLLVRGQQSINGCCGSASQFCGWRIVFALSPRHRQFLALWWHAVQQFIQRDGLTSSPGAQPFAPRVNSSVSRHVTHFRNVATLKNHAASFSRSA